MQFGAICQRTTNTPTRSLQVNLLSPTDHCNDAWGFQDFLEGKQPVEQLGVSPLFWCHSITATNFMAHPVLVYDETGKVNNTKSIFFGMTEPTSLEEWVSTYYYVLLTHGAHVSHMALPPSTERSSFAGRCKTTLKFLEDEDGIHLVRLILDTYRKNAGFEAIFWGSLLWTAFETPKTHKHTTSCARFQLLLHLRLHDHLSAIASHRIFSKLCLNVKNILPEPTTSMNLPATTTSPILADIEIDEAWLEEAEQSRKRAKEES
jgi:hypothetical protein